MVKFADIADEAMSHWFSSDMADSITYNGSPIQAHVEYAEDLDQTSGAMMAIAFIEVKKSDIADPKYQDPVIIGSDTWRMRNIESGDAWSWRLKLYRDERPTW